MRALGCNWIAFIALALVTRPADAQSIVVGAAASLTDVLPKLIEAYKTENTQPDIKTTFDATSRLAKQLDNGAPFDLFIAADEAWSDKVKLTDRRIIAGGHLVFIVPSAHIDHAKSLQAFADSPGKKLALAGENVPAGKYAEAALKAAGVWDVLKPRVVRADNVRAALKWVATGEVDAGIVYLSDTVNEPRVRLAIGIESSSHPPIRFVAGIVTASKKHEWTKRFLDFLETETARSVLVSHGFARP